MRAEIVLQHQDVIAAAVEVAKRDCPDGYDVTTATPVVTINSSDRGQPSSISIKITFEKENG